MPVNHPDEEPWRACYQRLAPSLLLFARQWLPAKADAEDAVQTAFVRFWRKWPDARPEHYPLLYAAVRSAALDLIRADQRRAVRDTVYHLEDSGGRSLFFDPAPEQTESVALIEEALQRLPAEQREVLVLRVWGELTFAEIAATLEQNINTVAARYRYGLEALRRTLTPRIHEPV